MRVLTWALLALLALGTAHAQVPGPPLDSTAAFSCTAPCTTPVIATSGYSQVSVVATGSGTSLAFTFEGTNDNGVTWTTLPAVEPATPTAFVTSGAANGAWLVPSAGWQRIRINVSGLASGTETFALAASVGTNVSLGGGLPTGLLGAPNIAIDTPADTGTGYMVAQTGAASAGASGGIGLLTGTAIGGESGQVALQTGSSDTQSGGLSFVTGDALAVGNIVLQTGTAGATPGNVIIVAAGGNVILSNLPTVAPADMGAVWADPVTHILKIVP